MENPAIYLAGQELIKKKKKELKHNRKYAAETALAIIIHVGKPVKPKGWLVEDYISACNDKFTVQRKLVLSILKDIKGPEDYSKYMEELSNEQLEYVMDHSYEAILLSIMSSQGANSSTTVASTALKATPFVLESPSWHIEDSDTTSGIATIVYESPPTQQQKQLCKKTTLESISLVSKAPTQLSKDNIKYYTRRLIDLGNKYGLNDDKQSRSLITAVACLVATCLRENVPVKFNRQTTLKFSKKRKREVQRKADRPMFIWDFSLFSMITFQHADYVRKIYVEYYGFLRKCAEKIPWAETSWTFHRVACHLDEVLDLFDGEHPTLTIEMEMPSSFVRNREIEQERRMKLQRAQEWIQKKIVPPKEDGAYAMYLLLVNGHKEQDILQYNAERLDREVMSVEPVYIKGEEEKEKAFMRSLENIVENEEGNVRDTKKGSSASICNEQSSDSTAP